MRPNGTKLGSSFRNPSLIRAQQHFKNSATQAHRDKRYLLDIQTGYAPLGPGFEWHEAVLSMTASGTETLSPNI